MPAARHPPLQRTGSIFAIITPYQATSRPTNHHMDVTTAVEPPPWNETFARAVVRRMVERKLPMFSAFHDIDEDDLMSEGLMAARRAWPKFKPAKSQASTYIYMASSCRLIDLWRARSRQYERDVRAAETNNLVMQDPNATPRHEQDDVEWLAATLAMIRRNFERYGIPPMTIEAGGVTIDRAQAAALLALKARLGLEDEAFVAHLAERVELVGVMGMGESPGVELVQRIGKAFPEVGFAA